MNIQMFSLTYYVVNVAATWLPERRIHITREEGGGWLGTNTEHPFIWEWETLEDALESCWLEWSETVEHTQAPSV